MRESTKEKKVKENTENQKGMNISFFRPLRKHATRSFLCTSKPQHLSYIRSMVFPPCSIYGMIPSQYYFTVRPFLASCEQTVRGATRESLVRFSLGLFTHLVIDLRRDSIIPLPLFPITLTSVSFMVARLAAWGFSQNLHNTEQLLTQNIQNMCLHFDRRCVIL